MGRKSKDKNLEEHLRGILRQLESQNKELKKQVSRLTKELHKKPIQYKEIEVEPEQSNEDLCPKCRSPLNYVDLGPRTMISCSNCSHRSILARKGKDGK